MDILSFAYPFYERYLVWQITRSSLKIPRHVAIILKETDLFDPKGMERLISSITIFRKFKAELVSIYVDILKTDTPLKIEIASTLRTRLEESFSELPAGTGYTIYGLEGEVKGNLPGNDFFVYVSLGFGGRDEITGSTQPSLTKLRQEPSGPRKWTKKCSNHTSSSSMSQIL